MNYMLIALIILLCWKLDKNREKPTIYIGGRPYTGTADIVVEKGKIIGGTPTIEIYNGEMLLGSEWSTYFQKQLLDRYQQGPIINRKEVRDDRLEIENNTH